MSNIWDIFSAIILTAVLSWFIYKTRRTSSYKEFAVSNNSIGLFLIFLSFSATFIGPGFSLALVKQGFDSGYFYLFIAGFYGLAKIIEGVFFAPRIRDKFPNALSIGDIIAGKESHNNKLLHFSVGLISFGLLVGFSAVLSKAGGEVMNFLFEIPRLTGIIIMTSIVVLYSFFGGIKATIITDAFQFILFVILISILFITLIINPINFDELNGNINQLSLAAYNGTGWGAGIGLIATWFLGEMLIPPTINRILATRNKLISKKGLIYSGIFMIVWLLIMLNIGAIIRTVMPDVETSEQLLLIIAQQKLKYGLFGAFAIAIVGIIMSSQDSLINSAAVVFTNDVTGVYGHLSESRKLIFAKASTIVVGLLSVILAVSLPSILSGLLLVYSIWAPAILVPILAAILLKKGSAIAAIIAMFTGILASLLWRTFPINEYIPSILAGVFISLVAYIITYQFRNKL